MTALAPIPAETYARTLADLHRLAVYVVSPAQRLVNGEIILESSHGGFSTFEYDGHVARVVDDRLVVDGAAHPITTLRAAAEALGIEPDVGQQEQFDVPPHGDLDEPLADRPHGGSGPGRLVRVRDATLWSTCGPTPSPATT